ncbi:PadR family transcriptional regulator [Paenibacillus caui]|uniref:PadR family transcriptional regulator n=1 Tax=Paenibacillus caui TaxID=2873927 RepID=UPI001CA9563D|nr:PadR family transcriptional regulator [Paenibacillus caui]
MNSLSYALLAMLVRKPCSGYELAKIMEVFWQAKHSQIYPLLAKLEEEALLTAENVEQTGKPNKKIYYITDAGKEILKKWISKAPSPPVTRDEFLIKAFLIPLSDKSTIERLFRDRILLYETKAEARQRKLETIREEGHGTMPGPEHSEFGRYIVHQRKLQLEEAEIAWCKWVLTLLGD